MIAGRGVRAVLELAPSFVVAILEFLGGSFVISEVTGGKDFAGYTFNELGCRFGAAQVPTSSNVARPDKDIVFRFGSSFGKFGFCSSLWTVFGLLAGEGHGVQQYQDRD